MLLIGNGASEDNYVIPACILQRLLDAATAARYNKVSPSLCLYFNVDRDTIKYFIMT